MSLPDQQGAVAPITRTLQIIIASLAAGVTIFLLISLVVGPPGNAPVAALAGLPVLTAISLLFALMVIPLSIVVPTLLTDSRRKQIAKTPPPHDRPELIATYQTQKIVGGALNEGAAFFTAIAYFVERNPVALGLTVLLILGIVARFPTRAKVEEWLEDQLQKLSQERQSAA
jgi:hypothetical protein